MTALQQLETVNCPTAEVHVVTVFVRAETNGEPTNTEPDKCAGWQWVPFDSLPTPLFAPLHQYVQRGLNPFARS